MTSRLQEPTGPRAVCRRIGLLIVMGLGCGDKPATTGETVAARPLHVFVGSHSRAEIAHLALDDSGTLTLKERVPTDSFPRALAWNAQTDVLYAVNDRSFKLSAFRLDRSSGVLSPLSQTDDGTSLGISGGVQWPINLALHPSGKWLLVGRHIDDGDSGLSAHGLDAEGRFTGQVTEAELACDDNANFNVSFDPAGRFAFGACDDDGLYRFSFDEATGTFLFARLDQHLNDAPSTDLVFVSKDRAYLYDAQNKGALVLSYVPDTGTLTFMTDNFVTFREPEARQFVRSPFENPLFGRMTVDLRGETVYVALPDENALGIESVGTPGLRRTPPLFRTPGEALRHPVHAVRSPVGPWLLVANAETGTVSVFSTSSTSPPVVVGAPTEAVAGASFIAIANPAP